MSLRRGQLAHTGATGHHLPQPPIESTESTRIARGSPTESSASGHPFPPFHEHGKPDAKTSEGGQRVDK